MKTGILRFILCAIPLLLLLLAGCAERTAPTAAPAATQAKPSGGAAAATEWDAVVAAARKEGEVMLLVSTSFLPDTRTAVTRVVKEKYGIDVGFVVGRGSEVATRLSREISAGLNINDVGLIGPSTITTDIKPLGVLDSLEPFLVLPEVKDPSKWLGGRIPYFDKDRQVIFLAADMKKGVAINTEMVKPGEIASYYDLLSPRWKGQVVVNDPSIAGGGNTWFGAMTHNILGPEKGIAFMRDLARHEPIVSRDERLMVEWVARGKYPVAIAVSSPVVRDFAARGAPITQPRLKEPFHIAFGATNVIAFKKAPHPNAQKLFINWFLSKEGVSTIFSTLPSVYMRTDVSQEGLDPSLIPTPQDVFLDENFYKGQDDDRKLASQIFGPLAK
ncbi:MAG: extracellular solute-binding protein [Chloroflexi bacterium]|nr:extracellular solute-binding protein [Chloroflexota bacterium]